MQTQTNQAPTTAQPPATPTAPQANQYFNPMSREDVQNLRNQIREGLRNGQISFGDQNGAGAPPAAPVIAGAPHNIVIRSPDGNATVVSLPNANDVIPPQAVDISIAFFITIAAIIIGLPLARAFARRMDRNASRAQVAPEVSAQLTQLNQAVDAIALEVERISEGQRYTTRLLSEQRDPARASLTTPHDR
jgi:ABC-type phosphate/phosphonate transport system permease subunit